jgi:23S rRNA (cytosine1962-C5)-methyltransferase
MKYTSIEVNTWPEYTLIDSGGQYKLEKFGDFVLSRPEPQAIWPKSMSDIEWKMKADAHFDRKAGAQSNKEDSGMWQKKPKMPEKWMVNYPVGYGKLNFKLSLSSFKHVGIFPEQASNWDFIVKHHKLLKDKRALNLFAYTGGASLALRAVGADVTHLDSVKKTVDWASENMKHSGLDNIRWIVEDAMSYVRKEVKRERKYTCIILDPPAYGRGAAGEKWLLEEDLNALIETCALLLEPKDSMLIINLYSMGYHPFILQNVIKAHFPDIEDYEFGDLSLVDSYGKKLPTGIFLRFVR